MKDTYVTSKELDAKLETFGKRIVDDLSGVISDLAQNMHSELGTVKIELAAVKADIADIRNTMNRLMETLDAFLKRLDDMEKDNTARDAELARIKRWVEQIAQKTGVQLEY